DIIWGNCHDDMLEDKVSVTIIATGFKTTKELGVEAEKNKVTKHVLTSDVKKDSPAPTENQKDREILEPQILKKDDPSRQDNTIKADKEITFEFEIGSPSNNNVSAPLAEDRTERRSENKTP